MATEIAIFPVLPGLKPEDDSSEAGQQKNALLEIIRRQPGFQRLSYSREVENPDNLRLYVAWDKVENHKEFTTSAAYAGVIENAKKIFDMSKAQIYHAHLDPHPAEHVLSKAKSPVTEVLTLYFPEDYSQEDRDAAEKGLREFSTVTEKEAKTCRGSSGGWVLEKIAPPGSDEKGTAFVAFVGWDSIEDHLAYRETQVFKDHVHLLRGIKDLKALPVIHLKFEE